MKDARNEIRRVVWPKRQETVQTTGIVLVLVVVFGLILWLLDTVLSWIVSSLIG
jgi:preprotein translocase subunit SecE